MFFVRIPWTSEYCTILILIYDSKIIFRIDSPNSAYGDHPYTQQVIKDSDLIWQIQLILNLGWKFVLCGP